MELVEPGDEGTPGAPPAPVTEPYAPTDTDTVLPLSELEASARATPVARRTNAPAPRAPTRRLKRAELLRHTRRLEREHRGSGGPSATSMSVTTLTSVNRGFVGHASVRVEFPVDSTEVLQDNSYHGCAGGKTALRGCFGGFVRRVAFTTRAARGAGQSVL